MKKSIFSLMIGAIVALSSCSKSDEAPTVPQEGDQLATFTIEAPALTRATPVTGLTRYIVEAYEGKDLASTTPLRAEADNGSLTLVLKKNTEYTFVFWADFGTAKADGVESGGYWNTESLKAVTVSDDKKNDIGEVAYCLMKEFNSKDFDANKTVVLKNATAQVNFVEAAGLLTAGNTLKVTYTRSATLNVATGKLVNVTDDETDDDVTHEFTNIAQAAANATIATDYVLAPRDDKSVVDIKVQLNTEPEKAIANVPFQQNYKTNIKGEYSNMYASTFTISNEVEDYTNNPDVEFPQANVGDFYMNDGTWLPKTTTLTAAQKANCIGIVFYVNADGKSGKIVSLDEGTGRWGASAYDESINGVTGIRDENDGATATKNLITARKSSSTLERYYYAFDWIYATQNGSNVKGRWYLPAINELLALYAAWNGSSSTTADNAARAAFNGYLTAASGTAITKTAAYWSSTEFDGDFVWTVDFGDGRAYTCPKDDNNVKVRAVLAF